jgi:hypothetical protein
MHVDTKMCLDDANLDKSVTLILDRRAEMHGIKNVGSNRREREFSSRSVRRDPCRSISLDGTGFCEIPLNTLPGSSSRINIRDKHRHS